VIDGETGYLVDPGDVEGLVDRMTELLADPDVRTRMGTAARIRCTAAYGIDIVAPRYLQVYEEVRG
jgi:glycosyltransferase involved in cell wall biosynthesis